MNENTKRMIGGVPVYVPTGEAEITPCSLARRLETLRGARIGILDNHKEYAGDVLDALAEVLKRDHGVQEVRVWRKDYLGIPSPYAREMAAACDAVVNGVGH